jgi:hypothetical protein
MTKQSSSGKLLDILAFTDTPNLSRQSLTDQCICLSYHCQISDLSRLLLTVIISRLSLTCRLISRPLLTNQLTCPGITDSETVEAVTDMLVNPWAITDILVNLFRQPPTVNLPRLSPTWQLIYLDHCWRESVKAVTDRLIHLSVSLSLILLGTPANLCGLSLLCQWPV